MLICCFLKIIYVYPPPPPKSSYKLRNSSVHPCPSATQLPALGHPVLLVSYGVSLQRHCVQNREVTYSFFLVFTQAIVYYTHCLHLAFFHVARYLKGPSVLFFVMTSLIAAINNGIYFLVCKSKGSYFTHHLTKLDFSDSQPNSKLG